MLTLYLVRLPEKYGNLKLPHKLPPKKEPMLLTTLPLPGYLEQASFCFSVLKHDFVIYSISHSVVGDFFVVFCLFGLFVYFYFNAFESYIY